MMLKGLDVSQRRKKTGHGYKVSEIIIFFILILTVGTPRIAAASTGSYRLALGSSRLPLTAEERLYVEEHPVVRAASISGIAPLEYFDENGEPQGIVIELQKEITSRTGLQFEYGQVSSVEDVEAAIKQDRYDLLNCVPSQYRGGALGVYPVSPAFLSCKTVLYINNTLNASDLYECRYAAVIGSELPAGVNPETVLYFNSRLESLQAVEEGRADYGFGNEFSVSYYVVQRAYQHISMIPTAKEARDYSMVYINQDPRLISIVDKAIASLSDKDIQSIVLLGTTVARREISLMQIIQSYGLQILAACLMIIITMATFIAYLYIGNQQIVLQNKRFLRLAEISDEYIYDYDIKRNRLIITDTGKALFERLSGLESCRGAIQSRALDLGQCDEAALTVLDPLIHFSQEGREIALRFLDGKTGYFKLINSCIYSGRQTPRFIVGKLEDVSAAKRRLADLTMQAHLDRMTGLLNAESCREAIKSDIAVQPRARYTLVILDIDCFKQINDTYGHAVGDEMLVAVAELLRHTFRKNDIFGRIGGDEYCVYLRGDMARAVLIQKLKCLCEATHEPRSAFAQHGLTLSIGVAQNDGGLTFEEAYRMADQAMYSVKNNARDGFQLYNGEANA